MGNFGVLGVWGVLGWVFGVQLGILEVIDIYWPFN
jgi:hypothetical protein